MTATREDAITERDDAGAQRDHSLRWRGVRFWGVLALLVIAAAVVTILTRPSEDRVALSPENPAPEGARAVAEVLKDHGVEVRHARTLGEATAHLDDAGGRSTLLFSDPNQWLDSGQLELLSGEVGGKLVLAAPNVIQLDALAPEVRHAGQVAGDEDRVLEAECSLPAAEAAGNITAGGQAYRGQTVCFPTTDGENSSGSLVVTGSDKTTVLGHPGLMNNATITENGNAALAIRILGAEPVLIWYQPSVDDLQAADQPQNPADLLPPWVGLAALWLLVVVAIAAFWRGRRMGPLVAEPLPVVVRSAETAEGRARLYQDARAVARAGENLRSASLVRMARHLGLGRATDAAGIVAAAARALSCDLRRVAAVLDRPVPGSETELVRWAQELAELEKEVSRK